MERNLAFYDDVAVLIVANPIVLKKRIFFVPVSMFEKLLSEFKSIVYTHSVGNWPLDTGQIVFRGVVSVRPYIARQS